MQDKDDYRTLKKVKKDEQSFQNFVKGELNRDGMVKKTLAKDNIKILEAFASRSDEESGLTTDRKAVLRKLQKSK